MYVLSELHSIHFQTSPSLPQGTVYRTRGSISPRDEAWGFAPPPLARCPWSTAGWVQTPA